MFSLSEIWIYPVKSLRGISLFQSPVEARGLLFDRRWMVVTELGEMLTQRQFPAMAQIETAIGENLRLSHGGRSIHIPLENTGQRKTVRVWRDTVAARDCGNEAADFLSQILEKQVRLVWMPEESQRRVDEDFAPNGEITAFSDGFPLLLLGQSTLDDLNDRILERGGEPVPMTRFRPNLVFTGGPPLYEDRWREFSIGQTQFSVAKPCSRCVITTVDQETGQKTGAEPIATLATYRKRGAATYLGQNVLPRTFGEIRVGQELEVLARRETLDLLSF